MVVDHEEFDLTMRSHRLRAQRFEWGVRRATNTSGKSLAPTGDAEQHLSVSAQQLRSLVVTHIEPILVRAGFAAGQWADDVADGGVSVIFCAAGDDYVHRHPDLVEDGDQWVGVYCVDITIEGSLDRGIDRFDVEVETLADLLARTGHDDDAAVLPSLLRLDDPDRDLQRVADMLSGLYAAEQDP